MTDQKINMTERMRVSTGPLPCVWAWARAAGRPAEEIGQLIDDVLGELGVAA